MTTKKTILAIFFMNFLITCIYSQNYVVKMADWPNNVTMYKKVISATVNNDTLYLLAFRNTLPKQFAIISYTSTSVAILDTFITGRLDAQGEITSFQYYKNKLYIGGGFDSINGITQLHKLVCWDNINKFQPLTSTYSSDVLCLSTYNNNLIIGCYYFYIGSTLSGSLIGWNGNSFIDMGEFKHIDNACNISFVECIRPHNNDLYISGAFNTINGNQSYCKIAKYDGLQSLWDSITYCANTDSNTYNTAIDFYNNEIYFSYKDYVNTPPNFPSSILKKWNGVNWQSINRGFSILTTIRTVNNKFYIIGEDSSSTDKVDFWDGNIWHSYGFNIRLNDMAYFNGKPYFYGICDYASPLYYLDTLTGININNIHNNINLFPVPTNGEITITNSKNPNSVEITDLYGKIQNVKITYWTQNSDLKINLVELANGYYLVNLYYDNAKIIKKTILIH